MTTPTYGWLSRRRLGAAAALDALTSARRRAEKDPAPKAPATMSVWTRLLIGGVAALVLAGAAVIALVVVGTQVGFYRAAMKVQTVDFTPLPLPTLDLPVFTPLATEGVVWMCTLMAVVLVILNRSSGLWTRAMWLFSAVAAFVNTFHAVAENHDLLGGVVTGGLSIAGPFVVHLFVIWVRHVRSGQTLTEARIETSIRWATIGHTATAIGLAVLDHTVHPITAARTISVWRTYRGITYSQAWAIASTPLRARTLKTYGARPPKPTKSHPETTVPHTPDHTPEIPVEDRAHGAVLAPERAADEGVTSPPEDAVSALLKDLTDNRQFEATVHAWATDTASRDSHPQTSGNNRARTPRSQSPDSVTDGQRTPPTPRAPKTKKGVLRRRSQGVQDGTTKQQKVIAEYWRRMHAGEPVDGDTVNMTAIARDVVGDKSARSTVSKTWSACLAGEHPDPTN